MNVLIRLEQEGDYRAVEVLTREAFWDLYKPGCGEHLLVHKIRNAPAFVRELSYVACVGATIVGNIMYSRARVVAEAPDAPALENEVLCMGPLGVLPQYQKRGVGSQLMETTITKARALGYKAIVIFGNPTYYHRFGFRNAGEYQIRTAAGENCDAFMALELQPGGLSGVHGRFHEDPVFTLETAELEEFEKGFPYKGKHVTDTQLK